MTEQWINWISDDDWLQAISIVVAVVTAFYYLFKLIVYLGKSLWSRSGPTLSKLANSYFERQAAELELAHEDIHFFIASIAKRFVIIIGFTTLYFIALFDGAFPAVDGASANEWIEFARRVFSIAASVNLGSLYAWVSKIRQERIQRASK